MNTQKFLRLYIQTKISGEYTEWDIAPIDLLRRAEEESCLHRLDELTYYCMFKTKFKDEEAVVCVSSLELSGPATGSSKSSERIMEHVNFVCKALKRTDFHEYAKEPILGKSRKSLVFLKFIKVIREEDIV